MRAVAASAVLATLTLLGLHEWKDISYWQYSEGVYALTARMLLDGADLYDEVVAAQPPGVFLAGAAALALDDGLTWLRLVVGATQVAAGVIAAVAVLRLTGSAIAATVTAPIALLLPWAAHEHGHLLPETVALPMLLGGAVLAARPGRATASAGVLLALALLVKLSFALPGIAVVLAARDRARAMRWYGCSVLVLIALATATFGVDLWRGAVEAQLQTGTRGAGDLAGRLAQGAWNAIGLFAAAAAAIALRGWVRDAVLLRTLTALSLGTLLTLGTVYKEGTELTVLVPLEAALLPLAVAGVVLGLRTPRWRVVAPVSAAFVLAQGVGVVVGTGPFVRPLSADAYGRALSSEEVREASAVARSCPSDTSHSGPPFIAFVARRPMPAGQPDQFITRQAERYTDVLADIQADGPNCP